MRPSMKPLFFAVVLVISSSSFAGEVSRALFTIGIDNREPKTLLNQIDPELDLETWLS